MNSEQQTTARPFQEPLLLSEAESSRMINVGKTLFRTLVADGRFAPKPIRLGRRKLWRLADIQEWVRLGCPPRQRFLEIIGQVEPITSRELHRKRRLKIESQQDRR